MRAPDVNDRIREREEYERPIIHRFPHRQYEDEDNRGPRSRRSGQWRPRRSDGFEINGYDDEPRSMKELEEWHRREDEIAKENLRIDQGGATKKEEKKEEPKKEEKKEEPKKEEKKEEKKPEEKKEEKKEEPKKEEKKEEEKKPEEKKEEKKRRKET